MPIRRRSSTVRLEPTREIATSAAQPVCTENPNATARGDGPADATASSLAPREGSVRLAAEPDLVGGGHAHRAPFTDDDLRVLTGEDAGGWLLRGAIGPDRDPARRNLQLARRRDAEDLREAGSGVHEVEAFEGAHRAIGETAVHHRG